MVCRNYKESLCLRNIGAKYNYNFRGNDAFDFFSFEDVSPATGTGTLEIILEDVNDNIPSINERIIKVCVCVCVRARVRACARACVRACVIKHMFSLPSSGLQYGICPSAALCDGRQWARLCCTLHGITNGQVQE